jgi:trans-aconitate methyltransferase
MDRHQARRAATVARLAAGLSGDALDYGCGWGDLTARLAPQFRSMQGVDVDAARVAFARTEYAPIPFATCDDDGVDLPDASVDVVFSTVVLHFVPDVDRYLAECVRLLRPAGHLVITIPSPDSMWMTARRLLGRATDPTGWGGDTLAEFPAVLARHGLRVESHGGFYDPPFDHTRTAGDVVLSLMNLGGHLLGLERHVSYATFRARKT